MDEYEDDIFDEEDEEYEAAPILESEETLIIMHRDAHFNGQFDLMLEYYQNDSKGVQDEIAISQIEKLRAIEEESGANLGAFLLSGAEMERIGASRKIYRELQSLYEDYQTSLPQLIADLILSEELEPEKEIAAVAKEGKKAVSLLLDLVRSDQFYDPLFPGYGYAPTHAAECLGQIGDPASIRPLFELLGHHDFNNEEVVLSALRGIGKETKKFLEHLVASSPITNDNIQAAIAYISFDIDPEIGEFCFNQLQREEVLARADLARYLIWGCEHLKDRSKLKTLLAHPKLAEPLKKEIHQIIFL